ncbi:ADP-ribose polymerase [Spirosoma foliorum]|uniref:NAD(+) ADP-ribosyltransferase n=1 Tax=Spirosoma foliorum TaxID=2710596 RepID=A0A7G5GWI1_9BACT|nr:ADP-ribose polymerase [Spirosoma foliorum]QMW03223.1 ADP-ribose polymerase [Spirosoma foliorum]
MLNQLLQRVWNRPASVDTDTTVRPHPNTPKLTPAEQVRPMPSESPNSTLRTVKLIMVTAENNNKFYEMRENENGTFDVYYGRVGGFRNKATHPLAQWNQKLREKTAKGYTDQTHLFAESSPATDASTIADPTVRGLMSRLLDLANLSIFQNYTVTAQQVTRKQVETAQQMLDELATQLRVGMNTSAFNSRLLDLFKVIPRRMTHVGQHLVGNAPLSDDDLQPLRDNLADEQATLDVMRGQVELAPVPTSPDQAPPTLLESMNLTIEPETDNHVLKLIKKMMGENAHKFDAAFSVRHAATDAAFNAYVGKQQNRKTLALWHGSRSENWLSILKNGLVLRPANAVITGKMFGYGIYFADQFSKSLNYTSLNGSVWTNGRQNEAYLAIYEVHVGEQLELTKHEPQHMQLDGNALKKLDSRYDSVFARQGVSLQKNEFIVYNQAQCTVRYIVRIKS